MTREVRFLIIATVIIVAAVIDMYVVARQIRYGLSERPYIANIKRQLRALDAAQGAHRRESRAYASEVVRVWTPPADGSAQGVRLHIIAADSNGYIAEGRAAGWDGRCVLAVGRFAGDSLPPGEPVCSRD